MSRRPLLAITAFACWTLFVWSTRVRIVWSDDTLDAVGKLGRVALAGSFIALAVATLAVAWRGRHGGFHRPSMYLVALFAAWTAGVWLVRGTGILIDDHGAAFKVVHTALGAVSIALAVTALRSAQRHVEGEREAPAAAAGLEELVDG